MKHNNLILNLKRDLNIIFKLKKLLIIAILILLRFAWLIQIRLKLVAFLYSDVLLTFSRI